MRFSTSRDSKYLFYLYIDFKKKNKSCLFPFGFRLANSFKKGIYGWKFSIGFIFGIISFYKLFPKVSRDCISTGYTIWFLPKLFETDSYGICWRFNITNFWKSIVIPYSF